MRYRYLFVVILALISGTAFSQSSNPFIGKWEVVWTNKSDSRLREAELIVEDSGGTWQDLGVKKIECYSRKVPIVIKKSSENAMTIKLGYSILQGCPDLHVRLKFENETVSGTRGSGEHLTMTKQ